MKTVLLALMLTVFSLQVARADEAPRSLSFAVPAPCTCSSCAFDVRRELGKFEGVKKVTLAGKDHRLDIDFVEGKQPLSALALALARLELGKGSSLLSPVPNGVEVSKAVEALSGIVGVATAKADKKARVVHLTFDGKTAVTMTQIDDVLQKFTTPHS